MRKTFRRNALLLTLAFGCLLMSLLVIQQSRTIDSQRTLIKQLFQDSLELNAMKMQHLQAPHR